MKLINLLKALITLAKPGIIGGNLFTVLAGFFLASHLTHSFNSIVFCAVVIGSVCIMASGCVINNCIDRDIDPLMQRTKKRSEAFGLLPLWFVILFGIGIGLVGFVVLLGFATMLSAVLGLVGWVSYVVLYSLFGKRKSSYAVHIGAISGAMPPLIGYYAIVTHFDICGTLLFFLLVVWQIPHSLAITIFRAHDYANASVKTYLTHYGIVRTKYAIAFYIIIFSLLNMSFYSFGYKGISHLVITSVIGAYWIVKAIEYIRVRSKTSAKKLFFISIIAIVSTSLSLMI